MVIKIFFYYMLGTTASERSHGSNPHSCSTRSRVVDRRALFFCEMMFFLMEPHRWCNGQWVHHECGRHRVQATVGSNQRLIGSYIRSWERPGDRSSTSDRNFMSFREWSAAKRAKRHKIFYHEWKITRAFPATHVSTYFFRKPTTFTIANS